MRISLPKTIRARLFFLVLFSVLPALGIIVYSGLERNLREIEAAKAEALRTVKEISSNHARIVEGTRQFLMTLAKVPEVRHFTSSCPVLLAELLSQYPLYSTLFVVNAAGEIVASAHPLPPTPISVAQRKYFREVMGSQDFSVGEYVVCPVVKRPVLHFAYPVLDINGRLKGSVAVSLDLYRYARTFPLDRLPKGSTLTFNDHQGRPLFHHSQTGQGSPSWDPPGWLSKMSHRTEGVFPVGDPFGEKGLLAFTALRLRNDHPPYFYIRMTIPEATALAQARRAFRNNLLLLGLAFSVALLSAWFLGEAVILRHLRRLVETAREIGQGKFKTRTGLAGQADELGELARALDDMAEQLEKQDEERQRQEEALRREIRERSRSEEAIKESEQKFRDLVEKSLVGVYLVQNGLFKYVNAKLAEIHGYSVEEMVERLGPRDVIFPEDLPAVTETSRTRLLGGSEAQHFEFRALTKDRRIITVETFGARTVYQGRPALIGTLLDITDRKKAEEALRAERMRFQALAENAPFGLAVIDPNGRYNYLNPSFSEILGYTLSDIPDGRTWFRKAFPDQAYRHQVIAQWLQDLESSTSFQPLPKVFTVRDKGGTDREISFRFSQLATGEILMTIEDMTLQKRLEAQLLQSQKMEAIGTLAGGIAHDFNNLLMTMLGHVSLMLLDKDPLDPDYEELKIIEEQIHSGADLTRQLLGFARGGKYEVTPINLNDLLTRSAEMFGRTRKEITLFINLEEGLWTVEADRGQIEQVFLNLMVNAWQAMPAGGEIRLETRNVLLDDHDAAVHALKPGRYVKVSVTDTGTGMDEATQRRIFEPFFTTKEMGRGSGLGLASAYGIVKNHGGTISVYSEKGKGSTFSVYLPASEKVYVREKEISETLHPGKGTILLVDDQESVLKVGQALLEKLGYTVFTAGGGEEAIALYRENQAEIDLVILDMIMPAMGGGEVYSALKKINPKVKVILSSGYSLDGQALSILERGCNGFLQKPFTLGELSKKIGEVLSVEKETTNPS